QHQGGHPLSNDGKAVSHAAPSPQVNIRAERQAKKAPPKMAGLKVNASEKRRSHRRVSKTEYKNPIVNL
ncbi:MAG: hypothetical protein AAFY83_14055, partial [Pseudomonadota bacterium]